MNRLLLIARKELKELFSNRGTLLMGIAFSLFFSVFQSIAMVKLKSTSVDISLDGAVFFLSAAIGFFVIYVSVSQIFLREKMDRVIETLLCAPVDLRLIWLGKVLGVAAFAYSMSLLTALVIIVLYYILTGSLVLPGAPVVVHIILAVPTFIIAFAGLMGFVQLLLGMRENRILNLIIFVPVFAALYGVGFSASRSFAIQWQYTGILFAVSLVLILLIAYLVKHLSKERIVTTLI
jgi:ABC-2 type transport system permease protein